MDGSLRAKTPTPRTRAKREEEVSENTEEPDEVTPTRPTFRVTVCSMRHPKQLLAYLRKDIDMRQQLRTIYRHRRKHVVAADTRAFETTIASASSHKYFLLMLLAESRYQFTRHLFHRRNNLCAALCIEAETNTTEFHRLDRRGAADDSDESSVEESSPGPCSSEECFGSPSTDRDFFANGKLPSPPSCALRDEPLLLAQLDAKLRAIAAKVRSLMDESEDNYCDATLEVARGRLFSWNWRFARAAVHRFQEL